MVSAPVASARYSRCRETAACTTAATSGATRNAARPKISTIGLLLLLLRPKNANRRNMSEMNPTATTRPKTIIETRMS